ncbi:MAG TPA: acylphosphatase [Candidatus Acidoferrum sp.]|nr:acylphosphatase [Candidatus Acidoferrum sp.]
MNRSVASEKQARRYFVSGLVQGVGFRYFTQDAAERLHLTGYVRNLRDGRVEAYAVGTDEQLSRFHAAIQQGPRGATVHGVAQERAEVLSQFESEFNITYDS